MFTLDAGDAMPLHASSMFEVKRDGEIVIISAKAFRNLARQDPDLALSAMPAIDRMLRKSSQMIEDMVFRGVKYRVIRALCEAVDRDGRETGGEIVLDKPPSAEEFAMQIGATRQSVSTIVAGLIRDGFVRRLDASAIAIPRSGAPQARARSRRGAGARARAARGFAISHCARLRSYFGQNFPNSFKGLSCALTLNAFARRIC